MTMNIIILYLHLLLTMENKVIPWVHIIFREHDTKKKQNIYWIHKRLSWFGAWLYSVPWWHIDTKNLEYPSHACIREIQEELWIIVSESDLKMVHIIYRNQKTTQEVRIDFCYIIDATWLEFQNLEPEKHSDLKPYSYDQLPKPMKEYVLNAIHNIEKWINISYSVH